MVVAADDEARAADFDLPQRPAAVEVALRELATAVEPETPRFERLGEVRATHARPARVLDDEETPRQFGEDRKRGQASAV